MIQAPKILIICTLGKMKKQVKIAIAAVIAAAALSAAVYFGFNGLFHGAKQTEIEIAQGSGANAVISSLKNEGIIKSKALMKLALKINGGQIKSGKAVVSASDSYFRIADILVNEVKDYLRLTLPEGLELEQTAAVISETFGIPKDDILSELENGKFEYDFIKNLPEGKNRFEGYLYPDTYYISAGASAHTVIDVLLGAFDKAYTAEMSKRAEELGFDDYEIITLASIIEKEASVDLDKVSSVFHNRLKSSKYPYLESCATVIYVTKEPKPRLTYEDIKVDSPYNTYRYKGLPPGPIASPGKAAIEAALYPADTDYYFFSYLESGVNAFSKTYEEHLAKQK